MQRKIFIKELARIVFYWLMMISYFIFVSPDNIYAIIGFYILLILVLLVTFKPVFKPLPRRIIPVLIITCYFILRQNKLDNIINTLLLAGILITFDLYFRKT